MQQNPNFEIYPDDTKESNHSARTHVSDYVNFTVDGSYVKHKQEEEVKTTFSCFSFSAVIKQTVIRFLTKFP